LCINSDDDGIDQALEDLKGWLLNTILERVLELKEKVERNDLFPEPRTGIEVGECSVQELHDNVKSNIKRKLAEAMAAMAEANRKFESANPPAAGGFSFKPAFGVPAAAVPGGDANVDLEKARVKKVQVENAEQVMKFQLLRLERYLEKWPSKEQQQYIFHRIRAMVNRRQMLWEGDLEFYDRLHSGNVHQDPQRLDNKLPDEFPTDGEILVWFFVCFMDDDSRSNKLTLGLYPPANEKDVAKTDQERSFRHLHFIGPKEDISQVDTRQKEHASSWREREAKLYPRMYIRERPDKPRCFSIVRNRAGEGSKQSRGRGKNVEEWRMEDIQPSHNALYTILVFLKLWKDPLYVRNKYEGTVEEDVEIIKQPYFPDSIAKIDTSLIQSSHASHGRYGFRDAPARNVWQKHLGFLHQIIGQNFDSLTKERWCEVHSNSDPK
jgi:hypothetical protein